MKLDASDFIQIAQKAFTGSTNRSENDLSSRLAGILTQLGLTTVVDSSVTQAGRKRPDILAYISEEDADLVLPAEIVVEAKKPSELSEYVSIADALVSDEIWTNKTFPYVCANLTRIQYFILTTFADFGIVPISPSLRAMFVQVSRDGTNHDALKHAVRQLTLIFQIATDLPAQDPRSAVAWQQWLADHLKPSLLSPIAISNIHNSFQIKTRDNFEAFATRLADLAAGSAEEKLANAGLFYAVRSQLPPTYQQLPSDVQRDLHIFLMTQHPGMSSAAVANLAKDNPREVITEFVAASIHSLIGRLFAFKALEDVFCIRESQPLIEKDLWIFASTRYDGVGAQELRAAAFLSIRRLKTSNTPAIQRFAVYGFFFDWIESYIDPVLFRSLFEMLASNDFEAVEGDLLGRFFEIYSQKINRTKRRALGQYYTPLPVVEMVWHLALELVRARGAQAEIRVLDPSMGSGTFLSEGARLLAKEGLPDFWERLTGFDISAQVLGIAYVNFYIAILSHLDRVHMLHKWS